MRKDDHAKYLLARAEAQAVANRYQCDMAMDRDFFGDWHSHCASRADNDYAVREIVRPEGALVTAPPLLRSCGHSCSCGPGECPCSTPGECQPSRTRSEVRS